MNALRIPYPCIAKPAFWGPATSRENFCEADYLFTTFIAEFVNTLTNLAYLAYAYHGVNAARSYRDFWPRALPYLGLAVVGVGSAAFHGSMKLEAQWADDLAMFFATGIVLHHVLSHGKGERWSRACAWLLGGYLTAVAVYHCYAVEVLAHQGSFVVMVIVVAVRTRKLINERIRDAGLKARMKRLAQSGSMLMFVAWILWSVDNLTCRYLKRIRATVGMPWGFLFELHGWWHLLTAAAVYVYMVLVEHLAAESTVEASVEAAGAYAWPVMSTLSNSGDMVKRE